MIRVLRRTRFRRPIFMFLGAVLFCIVVLPVFNSYRDEGLKGGSHFEYSSYDSPEIPEDRLDISFNLLNMDPLARKADFLVQVDLLGKLQDGDGNSSNNISINLRFKQLKVAKHQSIEPFVMTVPFIDGSLRDYPLEQFIAAFPIYIHGNTSIPFHATFDGVSQLFRVRFSNISASEFTQYADFRQYALKAETIILINLQRPPTTLMICVFMAALMWALAIAMVNIAWDGVVYRREIPPPLLGIGITMLFALPTLRNSQPGVPTMGCLIDMLSFFWSIVLISFSASALIFNWVLDWKPQCFREVA